MNRYIYKGYYVYPSSSQWKLYGAWCIRKIGTTIARATNEPEKLIDKLIAMN
jgi:hypothetical protein